jgi:D-glycero-D-manno-heptose 1,7-bisphosphate phosphatase
MTTDDRRPAVFFDRDGTVIEYVHYLADPGRVRLLPDAPGALRRLRDAGFALVVITNQSAIGRGMITVGEYERVDAEMRRQFLDEGLELDGVYYCPGMILRASRDLGLDVSRSWMVGDMISDALAGQNAGCRGSFLVRTGKGLADGGSVGVSYPIVDNLSAVADAILGDETP